MVHRKRSDLPPLSLYFGSAQAPEFTDGLRDMKLGVISDSGSDKAPYMPPGVEVMGEVDFSDGAETVARAVTEASQGWDLRALINVDEYTMVLWAQVCALLGLRGPRPEAVALTRSKSKLRRRFADRLGGIHRTKWSYVSSVEDVEAFARSVDGRIILKPDGLCGSFFIYSCRNPRERTTAFAEIERSLADFYTSRRVREPPRIVAEEFLPGRNHSVECLISHGKVVTTPVVDMITGIDIGHSDLHHFARVTPTTLSADAARSVRALASEAVKALELDDCLAHVEMVNTPEGPKLLEIGARVGGYRIPLLSHSYGITYMRDYVDMVSRGSATIEERFVRSAALVTPHPRVSGNLDHMRLERVTRLPTVNSVIEICQPGDMVLTRRLGGGPPLRIELVGDDPDAVRADVHAIADILPDLFVFR